MATFHAVAFVMLSASVGWALGAGSVAPRKAVSEAVPRSMVAPMIRSCLIPPRVLVALLSPASAAQPGFGPWSNGAEARVRLGAAGVG